MASSGTILGVKTVVGTGFAVVKSAGNPATQPTEKSKVDGNGFGGGVGGGVGGEGGPLGRILQNIWPARDVGDAADFKLQP